MVKYVPLVILVVGVVFITDLLVDARFVEMCLKAGAELIDGCKEIIRKACGTSAGPDIGRAFAAILGAAAGGAGVWNMTRSAPSGDRNGEPPGN